MKRTSLLVIATALLIVIPSQSFAATKATVSKLKTAGRTGATIPNTILSGISPPSSSVGINGDFYIDTKNANIYGPKSNGKWLTPTSLRGLSGINGLDGKNGSDAKNIANASSSTGPQGIQGEKGATGSTGAQGPAGSSGSGTGPAGAKGDTGASGAAGTSGTNGINGTNGSVGAQGSTGPQGSVGLTGFTGSTGNTGATGSPGAKGDTGSAGTDGTNGAPGTVGAKGDAGAKGDTGTTGNVGSKGDTGAAGPSKAVAGTFTFDSNLSGSARTAKISNDFGNFESGKKYLVHLFLKTYNLVGPGDPYLISMEVTSVGSVAVLNPVYMVLSATEYLNPGERNYMTLYSELTIDGTGVTGNFNIQVTATIGTGSMNVVLVGKYFGIEVGQIG